jgi:hypothetical protein
MPASYVTVAELRANLGIGSLYSDSTVEECCQAAQDQINSFLWFDSAPVVGTALVSNVATVMLANPGLFTVGESVTIAGAGSTFNGTYTITATLPFSTGTTNLLPAFNMQLNYYQQPQGYSFIQFAKTAADQNFRRVVPSGTATGEDTKTATYVNTASVRQSAMILAVDIWQARQVSQTGGVGLDGFSPSPYRMGNSMIGKIRGLLAPYASPNSMVG